MNKVLLIGDSITEGFNTELLLSGFNIVNKGIYGDNSEGVLKRLHADVIDYKPQEVYILIGTNDFALGRTDEELIGTIRSILLILNDNLRQSTVYLTSILPTRNVENRPNERINEVNRQIKSLCGELGAEYFDLHGRMADAGGELKQNFTDDGLHLTAEAYNEWASVLKARLGR